MGDGVQNAPPEGIGILHAVVGRRIRTTAFGSAARTGTRPKSTPAAVPRSSGWNTTRPRRRADDHWFTYSRWDSVTTMTVRSAGRSAPDAQASPRPATRRRRAPELFRRSPSQTRQPASCAGGEHHGPKRRLHPSAVLQERCQPRHRACVSVPGALPSTEEALHCKTKSQSQTETRGVFVDCCFESGNWIASCCGDPMNAMVLCPDLRIRSPAIPTAPAVHRHGTSRLTPRMMAPVP